MSWLLEAALGNVLVALVPAVAAVAVSLCCRRPALVHALWLLVLVKLVTPPVFVVPVWPRASPATAVAPRPPDTRDDDEITQLPWDEPEPAPTPVAKGPAPAKAETLADVVDAGGSLVVEHAESEAAIETPDIASPVATLAAVVACGWFAVAVGRIRRFSRELRWARPAPVALQERLDALATRMGIARPPRLLLVEGRVAPMVWGTFIPKVLLPADLWKKLSPDALDTLLVHELAHVRRGDPATRLLEFAVLGLYWWCPLVWLARRELRQAEEQCCDAWVVRTLPESSRAYAVALVDALDFLSEAPEPPILASGLGPVDDLKRRVRMILRDKTSPVLSKAAAFAITFMGVMLLPLVPGFTNAQAPPPADRAAVDRLEQEVMRKLAEVEAARERLKNVEEGRAAETTVPSRTTRFSDSVAGPGSRFPVELGGELTKADLDKIHEAIARTTGKSGVSIDSDRTPGTLADPTRYAAPRWAEDAAGTARRLDALEKKIDAVIREIEAIRKEIGGAAGTRYRTALGEALFAEYPTRVNSPKQ